MRIKMELLEDAIFGNGMSVPGGEDISVLHDKNGFPYFKGTTLKGIFREELERYIEWTGTAISADELLGKAGDDMNDNSIIFSDLTLSEAVKAAVLAEIGENRPNAVLDTMTNLRTFTAIDNNGVAKEGSLRIARCVNCGLIFYGDIECEPEQEQIIDDVLGMIKWVGTMRNRGFGKVIMEVLK